VPAFSLHKVERRGNHGKFHEKLFEPTDDGPIILDIELWTPTMNVADHTYFLTYAR